MESVIKNLKIFFGFITRRKYLYLLFFIITIIAASLSSVLPYFYKLFTDNLQQENINALYKVLMWLLIIRVSAMLFKNLSFYLGDFNAIGAAISARKEIFKHVQDLDFAFHADKSTGYLISAFKRGDSAFWTLFFNIHHRFLDVFVGFIVMLFFLTRLSIEFSFLILGTFIISLVITKYLVEINIKARRKHNEDEDNISSIIVDNMANFETVKLFSKESWEMRRLDKEFVTWRMSAWRYIFTFRWIDLSMGTLINISIFLVLLVALNFFSNKRLGVGDFILIFGFINSFYPRLFDLIYGFREIGKDFTDVERYFGLLDYDIQVKDPENPINLKNIRGEISFKKVSFSYEQGKKEAVNKVDLVIRQGQSVALVGRSGSGKTTLIKLLMRFYDVKKGQIFIDTINIDKFTKSKLRSFMGVVPQDPILFNNTIAYNIGYGKDKVTMEEVKAAAKIANLHQFIESLPKKYNTNVGERGIKLSGGQKQRLAIARMILSDPDIIIFDEATSQLDSENERLIQEALWKVAKDKTTIIIAHRLSTAMRADKIVVMDNGKIIESGSHQKLLVDNKSLYKHFWDLQANIN